MAVMYSPTLVFCTAWCVCAACAMGTQDPFDDFAPSRANTTAAARGDSSATDVIDARERNAVVLSLRSNPPTTPMELARAIQLMTRIQRWDEVGRWLDQLGTQPMDTTLALELAERIGSTSLLEIESNVDMLNDAQRAVARRIRDEAAAAVSNPARLAQYVAQLRSSSKGERLSAFDAIRASGNAGIIAMLDSVLAEQSLPPNPSMIEAFSLLGPNATKAWQAAMTTPHVEARERLIALVARAPKPNMGCELLASLHDTSVSDDVKQSVLESLQARNQQSPSPTQVLAFALLQLKTSLDSYKQRLLLHEVDTETAWVLGSDGRSVVQETAIPAMLQLARSSQAAQVCLRLVPSSDIASATAMASHWQYAAERGAIDVTTDAPFQTLLPASLRDSYEFACLIWDAALEKSLPGAQALAISNLSRWDGPSMPVAVRERMVAALKSGMPMVRFAAANALMKMQLSRADSPGSSGFDGSSRMESVGREMQQLTPEPLALIIGGDASLRSHVHELTDQFGFRFFEAASVAEVFEYLRSSLPIEQVFVVDHLRDLDLGQLIQRIRANPSTSRIPIALLADSLSRGEHAVADADRHLVMAGVPPTAEGFGDIQRRMLLVTDRPALDAEARILYKVSANNYFQTLRPTASAPTASGYDRLLAPTRDEQQNLLRIAADATESVPKREQASQIFVQSVRRFGLLITSESANDQYDMYNERGEDEPVTRVVLGRILDAIEADSGSKSWSEVTP